MIYFPPIGVDIFICNAGVTDLKTMVKVREMPMDDYLHTFNINFFCPVVMTKEALPHLEKTKGSIVFVSSTLGKAPKSVTIWVRNGG